MASLRRRNLPSDSSSSEQTQALSVGSVEKLSTVMQQAKQTATEKGVSSTDFKKFLGTAAEKNNLKLVKKTPEKKSSRRGIWSKLGLCYKVLVVLQLIIVIGYLLFLYSPTFDALVIKVCYIQLCVFDVHGKVVQNCSYNQYLIVIITALLLHFLFTAYTRSTLLHNSPSSHSSCYCGTNSQFCRSGSDQQRLSHGESLRE